MTTMPEKMAADPQEIIAELQRKSDELIAQQAATADILKVIARSPSDVQPVFDAIAERREPAGAVRAVDCGVPLDRRRVAPGGLHAEQARGRDAALRASFPRPLSAATLGQTGSRSREIVQIPRLRCYRR